MVHTYTYNYILASYGRHISDSISKLGTAFMEEVSWSGIAHSHPLVPGYGGTIAAYRQAGMDGVSLLACLRRDSIVGSLAHAWICWFVFLGALVIGGLLPVCIALEGMEMEQLGRKCVDNSMRLARLDR